MLALGRWAGPERRLVPAARLGELLHGAAAVGVGVGHGAAQPLDKRRWRFGRFNWLAFLTAQVVFGGLAGGEEQTAGRSGNVTVTGNRDHAGRVPVTIGLELFAADAARADNGLAPVPAVTGVVDPVGRLPDD